MATHQSIEELFQKYLHNLCTLDEAEIILARLEADEYNAGENEMIDRLFAEVPEADFPGKEDLRMRIQKNLESTLRKIEERQH